MAAGYVFGSFVVQSPDGSLSVTIERDVGPLEEGAYGKGGNWYPNEEPQRVLVSSRVGPGFGVDSSGSPYYDFGAPAPGEAAELWIDPSTGLIWLTPSGG